MNSEQDSPG